MDYSVAFAAQLSQHLRALRKARGLTQRELGAILNLNQSRIAEIEKNPSLVSVEQIFEVLAALGAKVVLRTSEAEPGKPTIGAKPAWRLLDSAGAALQTQAPRKNKPKGSW